MSSLISKRMHTHTHNKIYTDNHHWSNQTECHPKMFNWFRFIMEIIGFYPRNTKRKTPNRLFIRIYFCWSINTGNVQRKNLMTLEVDQIDFGLMVRLCMFSKWCEWILCFYSDEMSLKFFWLWFVCAGFRILFETLNVCKLYMSNCPVNSYQMELTA